MSYQWDLYKAALSAQERNSVPVAGPSIDRRVCEYTADVYNADCIRILICFACAQVKLDIGRIRSAIEFYSGRYLFSLPPGSLVKNFSMAEFTQRYRSSGSPLAARGDCASDGVCLGFSDWELRLHSECVDLLSNCQEGLDGIS